MIYLIVPNIDSDLSFHLGPNPTKYHPVKADWWAEKLPFVKVCCLFGTGEMLIQFSLLLHFIRPFVIFLLNGGDFLSRKCVNFKYCIWWFLFSLQFVYTWSLVLGNGVCGYMVNKLRQSLINCRLSEAMAYPSSKTTIHISTIKTYHNII